MKLFTPEKGSYGRWGYQTIAGRTKIIATKVSLDLIWCANEFRTGLNFCFLFNCLDQEFNIFFT